LASQTFYLRTGPFVTRVESAAERVLEGVPLLYEGNGLIDRTEFCDFHAELAQPWLRRWFRPKVIYLNEGSAPFRPSPPHHALPALEWGLNWSIATTANQYLIIHAACLERNGKAIILPGPPGSGKSTLCAGLAFRGWRLLSDELTLIRSDGQLVALARPISLKNQSIDVIRRFVPEATMSRPAEGTTKGTIVLLRAPDESVARVSETATARWIVFPQFRAGTPTTLTPRSKAACFIELADNAINYSVHRTRGFELLGDVIDGARCFEFEYSDLDEAIALFTGMADGDRIG
jgi:hypothetical protein